MDGLAVELRKQQNVAREGGKPARVEENLVDVLRLLLGGLLVLLQKRGVALDRADGRFELVRDVRDEVGLQGLGRVQLADHEVEAVKAVADIAKDALRLHMHAEVAARDLLHRARQARDGREERDGKARRRRAAEQQREDEQPHEHRHVDAEVLESPGRERGEQRHADKARHADEEKLHADIEEFVAPLFHVRTTLYPTPRIVTILKSGLSRKRSRRRAMWTSTVWVSVLES